MNEPGHENREMQRRPYQKPQLVEIPLRPDEAVLGGCKTSNGSTSGPGSSNCLPIGGQCFTPTS